MNKKLGHDAIYDARELGIPRMLLLGLQHLFAMFGATVLVPILVTGYGLPLSIQTTLLFAGMAHCCSTSVPSSRYPPSWAPPSRSWAASRRWLI